jgi:hypothetical protein
MWISTWQVGVMMRLSVLCLLSAFLVCAGADARDGARYLPPDAVDLVAILPSSPQPRLPVQAEDNAAQHSAFLDRSREAVADNRSSSGAFGMPPVDIETVEMSLRIVTQQHRLQKASSFVDRLIHLRGFL